jgi:hypothetical protein
VSSTPILAPRAAAAPAVVAGPSRREGSLRRALAMLVLPASIVPVIFLGPTLLRSPQHLIRQAVAEVQRLEGLPVRHGPLPPILAPIPGRESLSPAVRRGGGAALPARRLPR